MEPVAKRALAMVAIVAVVAIACVCLLYDTGDATPEVNQDVVSVVSFEVQSEEVEGTWISGSVLTIDSSEGVLVRLIAQFSIAEDDYGGIMVMNGQGLEIVSVYCSYQDDVDCSEVLIWEFASEMNGYTSAVLIGTDFTKVPSGGGSGVILVDFSYTPGEDDAPTIAFSVGYSESEDGTVTIGPTIEVVQVDVSGAA